MSPRDPVMFPKSPRQENPHLRSMARKYGCSMLWVAGCLGDDTSTTVLAHDNSLASNKGMAMKSHDWRGVFACVHCHSALDQGRHHTGEEKSSAFAAGLMNQVELYGRIASSFTTNRKDKEAARWALNHLAASAEPAG